MKITEATKRYAVVFAAALAIALPCWPGVASGQASETGGFPIPAPDKAARNWTLTTPTGTKQLRGAFVRVVGFDTPLTKSYIVLDLESGQRRAYPTQLIREAIPLLSGTASRPKNAAPEVEYLSRWDDYDAVKDAAGVNTHATPHFLFFWGNKLTPEAKNWNDPAFREMNFKYFEQVWEYFENLAQAPMPYADDAVKYKTNVYITGTGLAKHPDGFAFGGLSIIMHPGALLEGSTVVPHEFGHTLQLHSGGFRDHPDVGWFWECHANWASQLFAPSYPPALDVYAERMHYELESSRMNYGSWPFLQYMTEDPRFGSEFVWDIWTQNRRDAKGAAQETPFQSIMRLGVERGIFEGDGVQGFGDVIGGMAARNVTWDYVFQWSYQNYLEPILSNAKRPSWERTVLRAVPDRPGWFKPAYSQAPRQYGVNLVDLERTPGTDRVEVDFQGIVDETEGSDWRVTLVAVDTEGNARYSPMWRTGRGAMDLRPGETVALAIAAAPSIYKKQGFRPGNNVKRRFPYEVSFVGATPVPDAPHSPSRPELPGTAHPNGGGFVAATAHADESVYIAPGARVLGQARVTDNARLEDSATVTDTAKVGDNAIVSGHATVRGQAQVTGHARVRDYALIENAVKLSDDARVLEYVRVHGHGSVGGLAFIKGFGDVHTSAATPIGGTVFMGEDLEVHTGDFKKPLDYGLIYGFNAADHLRDERRDYGALTANWDFNQPRQKVLRDAFADNDGVLHGGAAFATSDGRQVLRFNGADSYAVVEGSAVDSRDITFDFQLKWAGGEAAQRVFTLGAADDALWFTPRDAASKAAFVIRRGAEQQTLQADRALPINQWTRVRISLEGDVATLIFDGETVGQNVTMTLNPEDIRAQWGVLGWGIAGGGLKDGRPFNGELDSLAIYRAAKATSPAPQ